MRANANEERIEFLSKDVPRAKAFEYLFENASDAIYVLDTRGNFLTVNRKAEELTGFKREDFVGKPFRKIIPLKSLPKAIGGFLSVVRGKSIRLELELKTAAKKTVPVEVTSAPLIINGKMVGTHGIVRDIAERKQMERKLEETSRKLEMLLETAIEGITVVNLEENFTFVNKAFADMLGYSEEELLDMNLRKLVDEEGFKKIRKQTEARVKGRLNRYELVLYRKDGEPRIFQVSASPLWDDDGRFAGTLGICMDITERKQMEKKLEEYSQQLEELVEKRTRQWREAQEQLLKSERLAAIGEIAAMVGHDLRNPLTGIAGAIYYLKTKLGSNMDKKTTEILNLIEENIEHSNSIITDLLEYSREIRLGLVETTPKSILEEALSLVKIPQNIQVLDLTKGEPKIKVDIDKMKRAFVNIIKNAIDAMPEGGTLTIISKESNGNLEIVFTDTGVGMTKDIMEKIWTPLFTTKARGMGLGLSICKRFVEAHGGNISLESTVGKGTTFTVTVPIQPRLEGGEKIWANMQESLLSKTTKA